MSVTRTLLALLLPLLCLGLTDSDTASLTVNDVGSASITPAITASRTSGVAPLAVHFDATGTDCDGDASAGEWRDDLSGCDYSWEFGEVDADGSYSETWSTGLEAERGGSPSKDESRGYVAGHVYESPGTYTVTLTVRDASGGTDTTTETITVASESLSDYCVYDSGNGAASAGSDGCPSGATLIDSTDFDAALLTDADVDTTAAQVLFRCGDTFTASQQVNLASGPGILGSFGSCTGANDPIVLQGDFTLIDGGANWRFMDLAIDGQQSGTARVTGGATNQLWLRVDTQDHPGATFSMGTGSLDSARQHWFLVDSDVGPNNDPAGDNGETNNGTYAVFDRSAILGTIYHDTEKEQSAQNDGHCLRMQASTKMVVAHSSFERCGRLSIGFRGENVASCDGSPPWTEYGYATDLYLDNGGGEGQLQIGQTSPSNADCIRRMTLEDTYITGTAHSFHKIRLQGKEIVARNIGCDSSGEPGERCITVDKADADSPDFPLDDVDVLGVSCHEEASCVRVQASGTNQNVDNIVSYAETATGDEGDCTGTSCLSASDFSSSPWAGTPGDDPDTMKLNDTAGAGALARDAGTAYDELPFDAFGVLRGASPDIGFHEASP